MINQRKAGAILGYINLAVKSLVNLVYTPLLLSFVGQGDYGVFQTSNSFVFSLSLLSFGFSEAYVRFYTHKKVSETEEAIRELNGMYLFLYILICAIAIVAGILFSDNVRFFFSAGFTSAQIQLAHMLMVIMTFNIAVTLFSTVFDAFIIAHERFCFQQSCQLLTSISAPILAYVFLANGVGAVGAAIAQLLTSLLLMGLNARYAISTLKMRFSFRKFDIPLLRSIAVFSAWIFINQICELINQNVPNILLGAITGARAVAVFAVAVQIRSVFVSLSTAMSNVFIPKINQIVATSNDNAELTNLMTNVGRYQMILFSWIYGGFILLGRFFIDAWAGESFADAYYLIIAMVMPLMLPLTQNTGIEIQRARNKHKARSVAYLIMALMNVAFTILTAPYLGYWAPAIAYAVSIFLCNGLFMNWYYHNRLGINILHFWRRNIPVVVSAFLVVTLGKLITIFIGISSWLLFVVAGILYSSAFVCSLWLFVLSSGEKRAIIAYLPFFGNN